MSEKIYLEGTDKIIEFPDLAKGKLIQGKKFVRHVPEVIEILERTVTPETPDGLRNIIPEHDEYEDCQYYHPYTTDDYIAQQNEAVAKKKIELTKEKKIELLLASIAEEPYPSVMPDLNMKWVPKYDKEKGFIWEQIEDSEFLGNKDNPLYWKEGISVNEGYYYTNGDILCRANKSGFPKDLIDENYMEGV